ncbi:hypothetical protein M8C13_23425 [Crossiella sp. SN42]|uniref:hypothetical protein n=1 Tax=Crossiella sp. SN42 TaxID=2944808 RepID=UPI00207C7839|nr:hypothetical protein [Crossiella sp. SN42]MCO1578710.1 hypothetical protein [Crossiella sp. SN42]
MGDHEFEAGETVLWRGRPRKFLLLRSFDLPLLVFAGLAVPLPWLVRSWRDTGVTFPVVATVVTVAGMLLMPVRRAWALRRTEYVVTGRRVLASRVGLFRVVVHEVRFGPKTRPRLAHRDADGLGTILFTPPGLLGALRQLPREDRPGPVALHSVEQPERVCALITEAWERAVRPGPGVAR